MRATATAVVAACAALLVSGVPLIDAAPHPAFAQGKQKDKKDKKGKKTASQGDSDVAEAFDADSVQTIRAWFNDESNLQGLPPGLAKREELPPGLQRQLERNGTLPPGLQKKLQSLPAELDRRLPPVPEGRRRVVVGGNVLLLDETTSLIVDLVTDIFD